VRIREKLTESSKLHEKKKMR